MNKSLLCISDHDCKIDCKIDCKYWKNKVNSITYDEIYLDYEEKSQTALFIYCHAWQSCNARLYFWR